jgi:hypothetical protein
LKDSHLRCAHSQVELLPAQTDPIMDCGLSSSIDYLFRAAKKTERPSWPLGRKKEPRRSKQP